MPPRRVDHDERLDALARLARNQDGVVSRSQLRGLGFDRNASRRQIGAGRWQPIGPRVVVLHTGPLTRRQRLWVAVLHSGPRSALAGLSAVEAEGLEGFDSSILHTIVPHGADATDLDHAMVQVRVRQARVLDIHPARRPARERLATAVVTAADSAATDDLARLLVITAVQQRLVRPAALREVLLRRSRMSRRRLIGEAIGDAEGGVHSLPERQWADLARRHALPPAMRQRRVQRPSGAWYLDCDFEVFQVTVEINGAQHEALLAAESDNDRRNVLSIGGRLVITLSSHAVRSDGDRCVALVAAALVSRGWRPAPAALAHLKQVAGRAGVDLASGDRAPRTARRAGVEPKRSDYGALDLPSGRSLHRQARSRTCLPGHPDVLARRAPFS